MLRSTRILTLALILYSCKKDYQCSEKIMKIGTSVYFKNFSKTDLDTVIVKYYPHDNLFDADLMESLIESPEPWDTLGILFHSYSQRSFLGIGDRYDVEIFVPATNTTFRVHSVYNADSMMNYTNSMPCRNHNFTMAPDSILVNGTSMIFGKDLSNNSSVTLAK